jgi:polysaccharide deacetylase family protein (PEP-CTERM system associated)
LFDTAVSTQSMPFPAIAFTFDLEDHRQDDRRLARYAEMTELVLALAERHGVKGTIFVVGNLAARDPALIRQVAAAGHELALHSWDHKPLHQLSPKGFRAETQRGKALLEDLTGLAVTGYRAPVFSLTPDTIWCADSLADLGFCYSSSVMPAPNPLYGFAGAPRDVFRWPSGLIEFPVPVARIGGLTLPYLGGIYLRYLPMALVLRLLRTEKCTVPFTYLHPFDFDDQEGMVRFRGFGVVTSILLSLNRGQIADKLAALFALGTAPPLGRQAEALAQALTLPWFDPLHIGAAD